jgi:hypothetical protein
MKLRYFFSLATPLLIGLFLVTPHVVYAQSDYTWLYKILWQFVAGFLGLLMSIGASILNAGINYFVIGFGDIYINTGLGQAVDSVWVLIRDVMNLAFVFGLIYIGIKIILKSDDSRSRAMLANLIIAALLVNFSLFFTKFVVDVSNTLSAEIALSGFQQSSQFTTTGLNSTTVQVDVAAAVQNVLGMQSLIGMPTADLSLGFIFGAAILFIIAAFVFAAGGIMLIIRFAVLNLFIALSPFMFIGWAFPPLARYTTLYWTSFLKRAFFAPIYLLFLYFSIYVLANMGSSLGLSTQTSNLRAAFSTDGTDAYSASLTVIPFFALACIFLIASIVIANKMGAEGASQSVSLGKSGARKLRRGTVRAGGGVVFGGSARLAQGAAGGTSRLIANNKKLQSYAARGGRSSIAGKTLRAARYGADASYDVRKVGGFGKAAGVGAGMKGGYDTRIKKKAEKKDKFYDSLETTNLDTPEARAAVTAAAARNKAVGEDRKERAEAVSSQFEKDRVKTETQLVDEIGNLTDEIEKMEEQYEKDVSNGTLSSDAEKAARQMTIDNRKSERNAKQQILPAIKEIETARNEALDLKKKADKAESQGNTELATYYREQQSAADAVWSNAANKYEKEFGSQVATAESQINNAAKDATNEVKYANQRAYEEQLERKTRQTAFAPVEDKALELIRKKNGGGSVTPTDLQIAEIRALEVSLADSGLSLSEEQLQTMLEDAMTENRIKTVRSIAEKDKKNKNSKDLENIIKNLQDNDTQKKNNSSNNNQNNNG